MIKRICAAALLTAAGPLVFATPIQNPRNGHYYEVVDLPAASWTESNADASSRTYLELQGHLATITSWNENSFLVRTFGKRALGNRWIGGYQDKHSSEYSEPAGGWTWVTGEPWRFTNWFRNEPNDAGGPGSENWLVIRNDHPAKWNDFPDLGGVMAGYVIEYEDMALLGH